MLEFFTQQNQAKGFHQISQPGCEVSQFMNNFFEAAQDGNFEEASTYYSDELVHVSFPVYAQRSDEAIVVNDHLAMFTCTLVDTGNTKLKMNYVLDKSEGYWQIIHFNHSIPRQKKMLKQ